MTTPTSEPNGFSILTCRYERRGGNSFTPSLPDWPLLFTTKEGGWLWGGSRQTKPTPQEALKEYWDIQASYLESKMAVAEEALRVAKQDCQLAKDLQALVLDATGAA